jgi:hypothetical protein
VENVGGLAIVMMPSGKTQAGKDHYSQKLSPVKLVGEGLRARPKPRTDTWAYPYSWG